MASMKVFDKNQGIRHFCMDLLLIVKNREVFCLYAIFFVFLQEVSG